MGEVLAGPIGILVGFVVLVYAYFVYRSLDNLSEGNDRMREIATSIHEGAMVFLQREYRIIAIFAAIVFVLLSVFLDLKTGVAYISGAV